MYHDSALTTHYARASTWLKHVLDTGGPVGQLLDDVSSRPPSGRPLATSLSLRGAPAFEMRGLMSKYNLQYRRPIPKLNHASVVDVWRVEELSTLGADVVAKFSAHYCRVGKDAMENTATETCLRDMVDWDSELASDPSSMMIPVQSGGKRGSCVAEGALRLMALFCAAAFVGVLLGF